MTHHMKIKSPSFGNGEYIPEKYTCDGENINPPLVFSNIPKKAKSLVLMVDSPEFPSRDPHHGWIHWLVWNISPNTLSIEENTVPPGAHVSENDFLHHTYQGPCPPAVGVHRYQFKLYTLDTKLKLPPSSDTVSVIRAMKKRIIEHAILIGLCQRK